MSTCIPIEQLLEPDPPEDLVVVNNNGSLAFYEQGATPIPEGAVSLSITFTVPKTNDAYTLTELDVQNTSDQSPLTIEATIGDKSKSGFTVLLSGAPDTPNYFLRWEAIVNQV